MVSAASRPAVDAAAVEPGNDYLATAGHYSFVAGRICNALRDGSLVLVAGDPPADPHSLSEALRTAAQSHRAVIGVPCGPGLTADALVRAGSLVAAPSALGSTAATSMTPEGTLPLFIFEEADRLSERQLEEICEVVQRGSRTGTAGVLLARPSFVARLEDPPLRFLKAVLAAQFRSDEIGEDEKVDFLRHQMASRQPREAPHGVRSGFFHGLAAFAVLSMIGIGALLAVHYLPFGGTTSSGGLPTMRPPPADQTPPANPIATATGAGPPAEAASITPAARPLAAAPPAPSAPPQAAPAVAKPAQLPPMQIPQPVTSLPSVAQSPAGQGLSPTEVTVLLMRGDGFLAAGDIASARLFYERAAEAGIAAAALRLGATFDPDFLGRAGVRGSSGDPAEAAAWYRRARDLGGAAAERLNTPERQPAAGSGSSPR
jgi:hypothetical protein